MISVCVPYYRNEGMLDKQLEIWTNYSEKLRGRLEFILVDDGSPEPLEVPRVDLNLTVYRILENKSWNFSGVKNLLMHTVRTKWALLSDIDYVFDEACMQGVVDLDRSDPTKFYNFKCIMASSGKAKPKDHYPISSFLVNKEMFWKCGGHDEDFVGHYTAHDNAIFWRLTRDPGGCVQVKRDWPFMVCYQRSQIDGADTDHEFEGWNRDGTRNRKLLGDKRKKIVPWSNDALRFKWERVQRIRM